MLGPVERTKLPDVVGKMQFPDPLVVAPSENITTWLKYPYIAFAVRPRKRTRNANGTRLRLEGVTPSMFFGKIIVVSVCEDIDVPAMKSIAITSRK